ncbi:hypothetical protein JNK62_00840 [bacterium]|nr:hypothetical protein [bacterium]
MITDSNVIDFANFKRPNSLAKLPVTVPRRFVPQKKTFAAFLGGMVAGGMMMLLKAKLFRKR